MIFKKKKLLLILISWVQSLTSSHLFFYSEFWNLLQIYLLRNVWDCIIFLPLCIFQIIMVYYSDWHKAHQNIKRNLLQFFLINPIPTIGKVLGRSLHFYYDTELDRIRIWQMSLKILNLSFKLASDNHNDSGLIHK